MIGSIVPPFSEREPLFPLLLLFKGEATKISFQTFVGDFGLTICLWVISWTHIQFGASEAKEFGPKMTCESCIAVWYNGRRDAMKTEYMVHENLCNWGGSIWMAEGTKMTIFGESINHNQDYGLPSRFREPVDEIHRNICPNPCRDGKGFKQYGKGCHFTLMELEGITFDHHLLNLSFHSLPKEFTSCPLIRFEEPRVPCQWRSMEFIENNIMNICALGKP